MLVGDHSFSLERMFRGVRRFYLSYSGLGRDAKLLILSSSISSVTFGFLDVTYAPYLSIIGQPGELIGTLMLVSSLSSAILMIPFGILADRYGRKPFLLVSAVLSALSFSMYFFVTDILLFAIAELIKGLSWAMSWGTSGPFLSEKTSEKRRSYAFGLSSAGFAIGAVIGYVMGAIPDFLTGLYGMDYPQSIRAVYLVTAIAAFVSLFPLIPVKEVRKPLTASKWLNITSWRVVSWVALTQGLIGLGAGFMVPWFSYYFTLKFSVNLAEIGILFAVSQLGMAIAFLVIPKIAEKIGNVRTIVYLQASSILVLLLISVSPSFAVASIMYLIRVISMNMVGPAFSSFFMGLLRDEERASGYSLVSSTWNIGNALPRPVAGYIMDNVFLDMTLYICASLYIVSTVIFYSIFRKSENESLSRETYRRT
ncbi:MAG: MFS transporter [Candidatus Bathyarchaeota archaeon]|nr:MFS transporter [Candidatus Bathyarchaeota archaeon]